MAQLLVEKLDELRNKYKKIYVVLSRTAKVLQDAGMGACLGNAFDELDRWVTLEEQRITAGMQTYEVTAQELLIATREGKIQAIKVYRDRTGRGLKDSKDAVEDAMLLLGLDFKGYDKFGSQS